MKILTKVFAVVVVAAMAISSFSAFAAATETTDSERPAFTMNMKVKDGNFKFRKMLNGEKPELTEEQKAAIAEKIESGEVKLGERKAGRKMLDGEKPELTEEQKAAIAGKIESGEVKAMAKAGKGMKPFAKKAPKLNVDAAEATEAAE